MRGRTVWIDIVVPDTSIITVAIVTVAVCCREDPLTFGRMHEVVLSTALRPCLSFVVSEPSGLPVRVRELEPVAPSLGKAVVTRELESLCPISVGMR